MSGCVCLSGWTGENCDEDIDECTTDPFICGSNRICKNLEGSHSCSCEVGFLLVGDKCEGELFCDSGRRSRWGKCLNLNIILQAIIYLS